MQSVRIVVCCTGSNHTWGLTECSAQYKFPARKSSYCCVCWIFQWSKGIVLLDLDITILHGHCVARRKTCQTRKRLSDADATFSSLCKCWTVWRRGAVLYLNLFSRTTARQWDQHVMNSARMNGHAAFFFFFLRSPHTLTSSLPVFPILGYFPRVLCCVPRYLCPIPAHPFWPRSSAGNGFIPLSRSHLQHIGFDVKATCGFIKAQLLSWLSYSIWGEVFYFSLKSLVGLNWLTWSWGVLLTSQLGGNVFCCHWSQACTISIFMHLSGFVFWAGVTQSRLHQCEVLSHLFPYTASSALFSKSW